METLGSHKFEFIILISVIGFVGIRADSFSVLDVLFKGISDRLDNLEQSFENRLDNVMNDVNKRLVRLENKVGIGGSSSDINGQTVDPGPETADIILDINESKRSLLKAMSIEKQILRESMHEYEDKWNGFKEDVIAALGEMNSTLEIQRINSEASKELATVGERIDTIDDSVAALNIKQDDQAGQIKTMDSLIKELNRDHAGKIKNIDGRINELNRVTESTEASLNYVTERVDKLSIITESTEASLISATDRTNKLRDDHANKIKNINSRINELNRITESTEASLNSVTDRITKLNGTRHAFSAYLSSTKKYKEGDIVVFDKTYRNTGYYDTRTGIFTVPKAGQYLLTISVEGTHASRAFAQIAFREDGIVWYGTSAFAEKGQDATVSATFIYYFEEGNTVWLRSNADCEFYQIRTTFTGVLLD